MGSQLCAKVWQLTPQGDATAKSMRPDPHEILLDLYGSLRALDEIMGATTADDILNVIFGSFCIGK